MASVRTRARRAVVLVLGVLGALAVLPAAPAQARAVVTDDRFQRVFAVVSGPLEGGAEGAEFGALVDGFAFTDENGDPAAAASTDFFLGSIECLTDSSDVRVRVDRRLRWATLRGTVTGSCFDLATQEGGSFTAEVRLRWRAIGPLQVERSVVRNDDGSICKTTIATREAVATGAMTWSSPALGIGGTGAPTRTEPMLDRRDVCIRPHPAAPVG